MRENLTSGSMRGSRGGSLDYYGAPTYALGPKGSGTSSCRAYGGWEPARTCSLLCEADKRIGGRCADDRLSTSRPVQRRLSAAVARESYPLIRCLSADAEAPDL